VAASTILKKTSFDDDTRLEIARKPGCPVAVQGDDLAVQGMFCPVCAGGRNDFHVKAAIAANVSALVPLRLQCAFGAACRC
jgi:hypothetical protein